MFGGRGGKKERGLFYLLIGVDALLCVVFGISAWSKLVAQDAFAASLRPLRLVPGRLVRLVAVVLTVVETALVLGFGWAVVAGVGPVPAGRSAGLMSLVVAGLLLVLLTTGIAVEVRRGSRARCACFGASERPMGRRHLVRNGILIVVVFTGLVAGASGGGGSARVAGALISLSGGTVVALLLIRLDDVVELFAPMSHPKQGSRTGG